MIRSRGVALVGLAVALALAAPSARGTPVPTLDPAQLHPGQKAEVRTVFRGDSVETFEAEIVGVLAGGRVEGDTILARATPARAVGRGVAQVRTGSPGFGGRKLG